MSIIENRVLRILATTLMVAVMFAGMSLAGWQNSHAATGYEATATAGLTDGDYIIVGEAGSTWAAEGKRWFAMGTQVAGNSSSGMGISGIAIDSFDGTDVTVTEEEAVWTYDSETGSLKNKATSKYLALPSSSYSGEFFSDTPVSLTHYVIGGKESTVYSPYGNGGYYLGVSTSTEKPFGSKYGKYINSSYLSAGSGVYFCKVAEADPVQEARDSASEELNGYRSSKGNAAYRSEQVTELDNILEDALTSIAAASTVEDVQTVLDNAKKAMDEVKTNDQLHESEKQELTERLAAAEAARDKVQEDLDAAKGELDKTKGELDAAKGELNTAKGELDAANSQLKSTKAALKAALEKEQAAKALATKKAAYNKAAKATQSRKVAGFKVKSLKGKKAQSIWKKTSGASGYVIYRAVGNKGKYKAVKTFTKASAVKFINKKLVAKKKYSYKIRPFTNVKTPAGKVTRIYGKWSQVRVVTGLK